MRDDYRQWFGSISELKLSRRTARMKTRFAFTVSWSIGNSQSESASNLFQRKLTV